MQAALSNFFYYFGSVAQKLPKEFLDIVSLDIDFIELNEELKNQFFFWLQNQNFELNKIYAKPHVIGLISPSDRIKEMSCCTRKKIEKNFFSLEES